MKRSWAGRWSMDRDVVNVICDHNSDKLVKFEKAGSQLIMLPDRTFTLERR